MVLIGTDMIVDMTLKIAFSYKLSKYVSFPQRPLSHCLQGRGDKKTVFELHVKARVAISLNLSLSLKKENK